MINETQPDSVVFVEPGDGPLAQFIKKLRREYKVFYVHGKDELSNIVKNDIAVVVADQDAIGQTKQEVLHTMAMSPKSLWIILGNQRKANGFTKAIEEGRMYQYVTHSWHPDELYILTKRALEHYHLLREHSKVVDDLYEKKNHSGTVRDDTRQPSASSVQSEKMVTLGQMVAGVAHEINTPSGAINAAIGNINHYLKRLLESCWTLDKQKIEREDLRQIFNIIAAMLTALDEKPRRTTIEVRMEQKGILEKFNRQNIPNSRKIAKDIARLGLTEHRQDVLILGERYGMENMLSFFTNCGRIISAAKNIKLSIDILTRFILALKSYSHPWQENPELADIHESIGTALIILDNWLKQRIQVDYRSCNVPEIFCYSSELSHVWLNLLHNAIQAIEDEGKILIETSVNDQYVAVKITDTGKGIPEDIQPRIFDMDFTTKSRKEGTGLGLHIAHQIIEKHGGSIDFTSIPGQTTFEVRLPLP